VLLEDAFQAEAFFVAGDFPGDAIVIDGRHVDAVAAREGDVAGDAGAFLGDGFFGDLDEDLLAGLEEVCDGGKGRAFGAIAEGGARAAVGAGFAFGPSLGDAGFDRPFFGDGFDGTFGGFGVEGGSGTGGGGGDYGTGFVAIGAASAAAAAPAAALETGAAITVTEGSGEALGLAGGFGAAFGPFFGLGFGFRIGTVFVGLIGFGLRLRLRGFGEHVFGGLLGGVGLVVFVTGIGEEDFTGFVDGVNVFEFGGVYVIGELGE
jgi:hypothetical protein